MNRSNRFSSLLQSQLGIWCNMSGALLSFSSTVPLGHGRELNSLTKPWYQESNQSHVSPDRKFVCFRSEEGQKTEIPCGFRKGGSVRLDFFVLFVSVRTLFCNQELQSSEWTYFLRCLGNTFFLCVYIRFDYIYMLGIPDHHFRRKPHWKQSPSGPSVCFARTNWPTSSILLLMVQKSQTTTWHAAKTSKLWDFNYQPQLVDAGFLNHQPYYNQLVNFDEFCSSFCQAIHFFRLQSSLIASQSISLIAPLPSLCYPPWCNQRDIRYDLCIYIYITHYFKTFTARLFKPNQLNKTQI